MGGPGGAVVVGAGAAGAGAGAGAGAAAGAREGSAGAATGQVVFSTEECRELQKRDIPTILVRSDTSPEDIQGMNIADGFPDKSKFYLESSSSLKHGSIDMHDTDKRQPRKGNHKLVVQDSKNFLKGADYS